jgi:NFU1 iron-sulfur cluster scaffold homolog, mitochondrial
LVPFAIREVLPTPNPNAMKFVLDQPISQQPMSFLNAAAAVNHPLAQQLFGISGVTSVLLLGDFVTINKSSDARWPDIKRNVQQILSST